MAAGFGKTIYGWTWVSYDPWGWAPYHYGRWFYGPVGWAWSPGPIYGRHYWSPAYVGFFGFGGVGVGVGFGFGNVGWVPLAPFEVFHPWWGRGFYGGYRSGFFGNHTTIVNNVNVINTYRNARVAGGVTGVNTAQFGRGGRYAAVNGSQLQGAGMVRGVLPVSPDRSSLRMSDRSAAGNFRQSSVQSFAGRSQTSSVARVPFEQQQRGMQQISRSNFSLPNRGGMTSPGGGASAPAAATHGWGRFGEAIHSSGANAGSPANGSSQNGSNQIGSNPGGGPNTVGRFENNRAATPASNNFSQGQRSFAPAGSGQAVRISPPMVQQRAPGSQAPSFQAPRNASPSYQAPRSAPNYQAPRSAPNNAGGGRSSGGGGGSRSSGSGGSGHGSHR